MIFGSEDPRAQPRLLPYWRFLETRDEHFPYAENPFPSQGLWNIYGVGLSDDVLRKIYNENAARVIPGVAEKLAAYRRSQAILAAGDRDGETEASGRADYCESHGQIAAAASFLPANAT